MIVVQIQSPGPSISWLSDIKPATEVVVKQDDCVQSVPDDSAGTPRIPPTVERIYQADESGLCPLQI
jgi:hypothetical protein